MKAILITKENQGMLVSRFIQADEDPDDVMPIGYYLVAPFREEDGPFELLTPTVYENSLVAVRELKDDWLDVVRRD